MDFCGPASVILSRTEVGTQNLHAPQGTSNQELQGPSGFDGWCPGQKPEVLPCHVLSKAFSTWPISSSRVRS